jgi:hypothetical protein
MHGTWTNTVGNAGFLARAGTVAFDSTTLGFIFIVNGNNTFFNFDFSTALGTPVLRMQIWFQAGFTQTIVTGGRFSIQGPGSGTANVILNSTIPGTQWFLTLVGTAQVSPFAFVDVYWSNATNPIVIPPNVNAGSGPPYFDTGWLAFDYVHASVSQDSNRNGKIDRILVGVQAAINGNFTGFVANVPGYTITGYADAGLNGTLLNVPPPIGGTISPSAVPSQEFFIYLKENSGTDTGVTPQWTITSNTTLFDSATLSKTVAIQTPPFQIVDTAPPVIGYTLAVVGTNQLFVHFSEPVVNAGGGAIALGDISFSGGPAIAPFAITPVTTAVFPANGVSEAVITLSRTLTGDDITLPVMVTVNASVRDGALLGALPAYNNMLVGSNVHRVSDIGLGPVGTGLYQPVWAKDQTIRPATPGIGYINQFDGSKWLRTDQTLTLEGNISPLTTFPANGSTTFWYDINVSSSLKSASGLWLPSFTDDTTVAGGFSGLVPTLATGNPQAQVLSEATSLSAYPRLRDFQIPSGNPKAVDGSTLNFLFSIPQGAVPLFTARVVDPTAPDWFRHITPWAFDLRTIRAQRGGVQILNNVINPDKGDLATLQYFLGTTGSVTVTVFDLSGSIVNVLVRGTQTAGEYEVTWDGRNRGRAAVTRGIYFVRIVAPGLDEIRKVLVVR